MYKGKKIIALCVNKLNEVHNRKFVKAIYDEAIKRDVRVIVYNSITDYFFSTLSDAAQEKIYDLLTFEYADALIVIPETYKNKGVLNKLTDKAKEHNCPIVAYAEYLEEADCNILENHTEVFGRMVEHLITVHNIKRPYLMSGVQNNPVAVQRENEYFRVLEENGIPAEKDVYMGYGDFWTEPTLNTMNAFLDKVAAGEVQMPDAVVCVNDTTAVTVSDSLREHGYSVPEDVLVTGFDGIDPDNIIIPSITTCEHDYENYAKKAMDAALDLSDGKKVEAVQNTQMRLKLAETCGCSKVDHLKYQTNSRKIYRQFVESDFEASHWAKIPLKCVNPPTLSNVRKVLSKYLSNSSAVSLNENFMEMDSEIKVANPLSVKQMIICGKDEKGNELMPIYYQIENVIDIMDQYLHSPMQIITIINFNQTVFGFAVFELHDFEEDPAMITKFVFNFGNALTILNTQLKNTSLLNQIDDITLTDAYTGLPTLKGIDRVFEERLRDIDVNHSNVALTVYSVDNWNEILKKFGLEEAEYVLDLVADTLRDVYPKRSIIGKITDMEFSVSTDFEDYLDMDSLLDECEAKFYERINRAVEENKESGHYYDLPITHGRVTTKIEENTKLIDLVMMATNEMLAERLRLSAPANTTVANITSDDIRLFEELIDKNLFKYVYQPIVETKYGEIFAYETLMRTDNRIGFFPDKILDIAESLDKLYEIEKATLFNSMKNYWENKEKFKDRYLFVNAIPGNFLDDEDRNKLESNYDVKKYKIVIEVTEQFKNPEKDMENLMHAIKKNDWDYAIDDYGSGNSNIESLLKYKPNLIKIDRFLITDIQNSPNKQSFVKNIINFSKANGIKSLAEGVETAEELEYVIKQGIDFVQGYYMARPSEEIIDSIPEEIKIQIRKFAKEAER